MNRFHKVKITNSDPNGLPMGTYVEIDGKPISYVKEVEFHQSDKDFTTVKLFLIGEVDFVSDGCTVILIMEDGRKFRVLEEMEP